jgi:hypothetical protein
MAKLEPVMGIVAYSLTHLSGADLTVLDLALCTLKDDGAVLVGDDLHASLVNLHNLVLQAKRDAVR